MLRYLLDTSIVIDVLKRRPVELLAAFNANARRMAISSIAPALVLGGIDNREIAVTFPGDAVTCFRQEGDTGFLPETS
ncbi:MAG: hypothetical protein ACKO8O_06440 [Betaproteobacteria bacterium]